MKIEIKTLKHQTQKLKQNPQKPRISIKNSQNSTISAQAHSYLLIEKLTLQAASIVLQRAPADGSAWKTCAMY